MSTQTTLDTFFRRWGKYPKEIREEIRNFISGTVEAETATTGITLSPLSAGQISALPNNTLYMDGSNVLKWKNNSGTSQTVTVV